MSETLSLNKLEKLIELETQLRGEYQEQLDAKDAVIDELQNDKTALEAKMAGLEETIFTQLGTIKDMSSKSSDAQALEQRNRELEHSFASPSWNSPPMGSRSPADSTRRLSQAVKAKRASRMRPHSTIDSAIAPRTPLSMRALTTWRLRALRSLGRAQLLAQQMLTTLWRLHSCGVIPAPADAAGAAPVRGAHGPARPAAVAQPRSSRRRHPGGAGGGCCGFSSPGRGRGAGGL